MDLIVTCPTLNLGYIGISCRQARGVPAVLINGARIAATALAACLVLSTGAEASPLASPWAEAHGAKARLVAGTATSGTDAPRVVAGVAINLSQGWKTYWRSPGDSGGLPPSFDWSGSANLASAQVLYPAPRRFRDAMGDSIGYSEKVIFPLEFRPKDPSRPVDLRLRLYYGICQEICVPAEAELSLRIPAGVTLPGSPEISSALAAVPRDAEKRQPQDPVMTLSEAHLDGDRPKLVLEAVFPGSASSADMFIEGPDGAYVPLPVRVAERGDTVRFAVDLTRGADVEELRGKAVRITMVSDRGRSEAYWTIE